ncbi:TetR family transcriptional regulator [Kribbella sp. NPDC055071]
MSAGRVDQRRETGRRTRERLLAAALELLAQRGASGVTLREITDAADANVAAVSYHFGSLGSLCDAAIASALEQYLDAQIQSMSTLAPGSSIEQLAAAFARPMVRALSADGDELAIMRTVARVAADPPEGWDRLAGKFDRTRKDAVAVLAVKLPGVGRAELNFRTRCAAGLLNWLALAPLGAEIAGRSERQIENLLLPVVLGAFRGGSDAR